MRELPPTAGGRRYKKLLSFIWIAAIAGITLSARTMLYAILDAPFVPAGRLWRTVAKPALFICGGGIMLWIAYRGTRRNLAPPEWLFAGSCAPPIARDPAVTCQGWACPPGGGRATHPNPKSNHCLVAPGAHPSRDSAGSPDKSLVHRRRTPSAPPGDWGCAGLRIGPPVPVASLLRAYCPSRANGGALDARPVSGTFTHQGGVGGVKLFSSPRASREGACIVKKRAGPRVFAQPWGGITLPEKTRHFGV